MRLTEFCEISIKEIENYLRSLDPLEVSLWLSGRTVFGDIIKKSNKYGIRHIQIRRLPYCFPNPDYPENLVLDIYFFKSPHLISFQITDYEVKDIQVCNGTTAMGSVRYVEDDYKNKISIKSLIPSNQSVSIVFSNKKK